MAHRLLLYNDGYDDTYFVNWFVAGLEEEIRSVIALHQPKDVDIASALALLQEEELSRSKAKVYGKMQFRPHPDRTKWTKDKGKTDTGGKEGLNKESEDKLASL